MSFELQLSAISQRLEFARKTRGFKSPATFAKKCGIPSPTYLGHEAGLNDPRISLLMLYSEVLRVPLAWFLFGGLFDFAQTNISEEPLSDIKAKIAAGLKTAGDRLKAARKARGHKSQVAFSKLAGVARTSLYAHEANFGKAGCLFVATYCTVLDVSVNWLAWGSETPLSHKPSENRDENELKLFSLAQRYLEAQLV